MIGNGSGNSVPKAALIRAIISEKEIKVLAATPNNFSLLK